MLTALALWIPAAAALAILVCKATKPKGWTDPYGEGCPEDGEG